MTDRPFKDFKIASHELLDTLQVRSKCPECNRSRMYYCYTCYVPVSPLQGKIPNVKLPVKIDIIKHPSEVDGKSTCAHTKILAAEDVQIYTFPCIPEYPKDGSVLLVFPREYSYILEDLVQQNPQNEQQNPNCNVTIVHEPFDDPETAIPNSKQDKTFISNGKSRETIPEKSDISNGNSRETTEENSHIVNDYSKETTKENCMVSNCKLKEKTLQNVAILNDNSGETTLKKSDILNGNSGETTQDKSNMSNGNSGKTAVGSPFITGVEANSMERKRKIDCDDTTLERNKLRKPVFARAVFIDSTWNQTCRISSDERLKGLPSVVLKDRESLFWRHQKGNPASYLSTVEAVYYLVRDYHTLFISTNYNGEYDNLLFFFAYMYNKIHGLYSHKTLKADEQRKKLKK